MWQRLCPVANLRRFSVEDSVVLVAADCVPGCVDVDGLKAR